MLQAAHVVSFVFPLIAELLRAVAWLFRPFWTRPPPAPGAQL